MRMVAILHRLPTRLALPLALAASMFGPHGRASAETVTLQAKSYISPIDLRDAGQWDPDAKSCQETLAAIVNCGTLGGDNPPDGNRGSRNFRIFSQLSVAATCNGNRVASWEIKPPELAFGTEFVVFLTGGEIMTPLSVAPAAKGADAAQVKFSYAVRGQPNVAAITTMDLAKHRSCRYIWHRVSGTLVCRAGKPALDASIAGSAFPSHALWGDGVKVKNVPQGPFRNLWKCDAKDPLYVE